MTILYQEPITQWTVFYTILIFVMVFLLLTIFILVILFACAPTPTSKDKGAIFIFAFCLWVVVIITCLMLKINGENTCDTDRNKYEVILDSEYSANELYNNYNIIERRGDIWIIEDKEDTKDK